MMYPIDWLLIFVFCFLKRFETSVTKANGSRKVGGVDQLVQREANRPTAPKRNKHNETKQNKKESTLLRRKKNNTQQSIIKTQNN